MTKIPNRELLPNCSYAKRDSIFSAQFFIFYPTTLQFSLSPTAQRVLFLAPLRQLLWQKKKKKLYKCIAHTVPCTKKLKRSGEIREDQKQTYRENYWKCSDADKLFAFVLAKICSDTFKPETEIYVNSPQSIGAY